MKKLTATLPALLAIAAATLAQEAGSLHQDFRGKPLDGTVFRFMGPNARDIVEQRAEGLRIKLPAEGVERQEPIGIALHGRMRIKGDFEITTTYELLKNDRPRDGYGAGASLFLQTDTPSRDGILLGRFHRAKEGQVYTFGHNRTPEGKKRVFKDWPYVPTEAMAGKLRLTRVGKVITASVAEGDAGEFRDLATTEMGDELSTVRIAADPGNSQTAVVDVRFLDLTVKTGDVPIEVAPLPPPPTRRLLWLGIGVLVLLAFLLGVGLLVFFMQRRKEVRVKTPTR